MSEIATTMRDDLAVLADQARAVVDTEFVPRTLRGNLPATYACLLAGRELGLGPMEALRKIHMIDGRPSMSAEAMVGLAHREGHSITGELTPDSATVTGKRADNDDQMTVTWTLEMAKEAGLVGKDNWKRYPQAMLWARAASQLCRMLFPDVFTTVAHTPDEMKLSQEDRVVDALENLPAPGEPAEILDAAEAALPPPEPVVEAAPDPEPVQETTSVEPEAGEQSSFVPPPGAYERE